MMKQILNLFFLLLLSTQVQNSLAQVCNAFNPDLIENDIDYPSIVEANFSIIFPAEFDSGEVIIVAPDEDDLTGGIAGTFWHIAKRRIADGFKASFTFEYTGNSDGIAFVIQNDKIFDIEGTGGAGLGFFDGLDKYIAVGIDVCPILDRDDRFPCNTTSDVEITVSGQGIHPAPVVQFGSALVSRSEFPRGTGIDVEVYYLADANSIVVFIDGNEVLDANMTGSFENVESHFGSRFGHFGFTASNGFSAVDAGEIKVTSFTLDKFIAEVRVSEREGEGFPKKVILGKQTVIDIVVVDSCNQPSEATKIALNITVDKLDGYLEAVTDTGIQTIPYVTIADRPDGNFSMVFIMPTNILADWTLVATVETSSGPVLIQGAPLEGAIKTIVAPPEGLPLYGLILLISLLSILVLAMVYVIRRLYRYRQKLKDNEEVIAFGQEYDKVKRLEKEVVYSMNPLMGTLEEMQEKLKKNNEILDKLKRGDVELENIDATIGDLKEQNKKLRDELKKLKKEDQMGEALANRRSIRQAMFGKTKKQEFGQERN